MYQGYNTGTFGIVEYRSASTFTTLLFTISAAVGMQHKRQPLDTTPLLSLSFGEKDVGVQSNTGRQRGFPLPQG